MREEVYDVGCSFRPRLPEALELGLIDDGNHPPP
jgi:hypothetical protein